MVHECLNCTQYRGWKSDRTIRLEYPASIARAVRAGRLVVVAPEESTLAALSPKHVSLERKADAERAIKAVAAILEKDDVIVAAAQNESQAAAIGKIVEASLGHPFVMISLGNPHDLENIAGATAYFAAYGNTMATEEALVKVLRGVRPARGTLPIALRRDPSLFRCPQ